MGAAVSGCAGSGDDRLEFDAVSLVEEAATSLAAKTVERLDRNFLSRTSNFSDSEIRVVLPKSGQVLVFPVLGKPAELFAGERLHCVKAFDLGGSPEVCGAVRMWSHLGKCLAATTTASLVDSIVVVEPHVLMRLHGAPFDAAVWTEHRLCTFVPSHRMEAAEIATDFEQLAADELALGGAPFCMDMSDAAQHPYKYKDILLGNPALWAFASGPAWESAEKKDEHTICRCVQGTDMRVGVLEEFDVDLSSVPASVSVVVLCPAHVPFFYSAFMRCGVRVALWNTDMSSAAVDSQRTADSRCIRIRQAILFAEEKPLTPVPPLVCIMADRPHASLFSESAKLETPSVCIAHGSEDDESVLAVVNRLTDVLTRINNPLSEFDPWTETLHVGTLSRLVLDTMKQGPWQLQYAKRKRMFCSLPLAASVGSRFELDASGCRRTYVCVVPLSPSICPPASSRPKKAKTFASSRLQAEDGDEMAVDKNAEGAVCSRVLKQNIEAFYKAVETPYYSLLDPKYELYWSAVTLYAFCSDHHGHRHHAERIVDAEITRARATVGIAVPTSVPIAAASKCLLSELGLVPVRGTVRLENTAAHRQAYYVDMARVAMDARAAVIRGRIFTTRRHAVADEVFGPCLLYPSASASNTASDDALLDIEEWVPFMPPCIQSIHTMIRNDKGAMGRQCSSKPWPNHFERMAYLLTMAAHRIPPDVLHTYILKHGVFASHPDGEAFVLERIIADIGAQSLKPIKCDFVRKNCANRCPHPCTSDCTREGGGTNETPKGPYGQMLLRRRKAGCQDLEFVTKAIDFAKMQAMQVQYEDDAAFE